MKSINWFGSDLSHSETFFVQLSTGIIDIFCVVIASILVMQGKRKYLKVIRLYLWFLKWFSISLLAYYATTYGELNISFMWSGIISSFTLWLMSTASYHVFVEYMYLLQKRKQEIYDEKNKKESEL